MLAYQRKGPRSADISATASTKTRRAGVALGSDIPKPCPASIWRFGALANLFHCAERPVKPPADCLWPEIEPQAVGHHSEVFHEIGGVQQGPE